MLYTPYDDGDGSANDLGVSLLVGQQYAALPPADRSPQEDIVRAIIATLGPLYRPLWLTKLWQSPNRGLFRTVTYVHGRYVPNPRTDREHLPNVILPAHAYLGIDWKNPLAEDDIEDGLTHEQRSAGALPRFHPLTWKLVEDLRKGMWEDRNVGTEEYIRRNRQARLEAERKARLETDQDVGYFCHTNRTNTLDDGSKPQAIARTAGFHPQSGGEATA